MIPDYLITPVVGAVIGYFTNWLAIKMIFRPYTEKRIFNIRVPFTPGLMPKERYVLSKKVGEVISQHLLTEEVMANALISNDIHINICSLIDEAIKRLSDNDATIKDIQMKIYNDSYLIDALVSKTTNIIVNILKKEQLQDSLTVVITRNIKDLLQKEAKDIHLDKFVSWLEKLFIDYGDEYIKGEDFENLVSDYFIKLNKKISENESTILETVSPELIEKTKALISDKIPSISKMLLTLLQIPEFEEKLKILISSLINNNVSKLVLVFVNSDKVAENIFSTFKEYLNNEENYTKTYNMFVTYIDKFCELKINELTQKIPENYKDYPLASIIVDMTRKICTNNNLNRFLKSMTENLTKLDDKNIYDIIYSVEPNIMDKLSDYIRNQIEKISTSEKLYMYIYKNVDIQVNNIINMKLKNIVSQLTNKKLDFVKKVILNIYDFIIKKAMVNILKAMNISKVIEDRINDFEIKEAEDIVINVVKKELRAITFIGGVLGFIIGLLPLII